MDQITAKDAFAALAHDTRLSVFRLLVRQGPGGLPALEIARRLGAPPSTLSSHLASLKRAGLLNAERRHREILYAANLAAVNDIVRFLLDDCCGGDPAACAGLDGMVLPTTATPSDA
ncbi:transcriptional regulator [Rhodovulum viride]|uniref:Transcriptional regulator n=1 Tax=Rhodovulum viride TaxID=1231134 RepID=A0ABX9DDX9_9RHOB|nr:metalloregulator ArsR/SmtB family transcription factor [Rhodovulum viride]RAP40542.1 transcriptional regulator [Rhodovulum viride]